MYLETSEMDFVPYHLKFLTVDAWIYEVKPMDK